MANLRSACEAALSPVAKTQIDSVREALAKDINHLDVALDKLDIMAEDIETLEWLGRGAQATVIKIKYLNRTLALKIYFADEEDDFEASVILQKHLGELGVAPSVAGILRGEELHGYLQTLDAQNFFINKPQPFLGVLMEITPSNFLKESGVGVYPKAQVTHAHKKQLRAQAVHYLDVLESLSITPFDIDAVVGFDGRLQLVDLGSYRYEYFKNNTYESQKRAALYKSHLKKLLDFIEDGTELNRAN